MVVPDGVARRFTSKAASKSSGPTMRSSPAAGRSPFISTYCHAGHNLPRTRTRAATHRHLPHRSNRQHPQGKDRRWQRAQLIRVVRLSQARTGRSVCRLVQEEMQHTPPVIGREPPMVWGDSVTDHIPLRATRMLAAPYPPLGTPVPVCPDAASAAQNGQFCELERSGDAAVTSGCSRLARCINRRLPRPAVPTSCWLLAVQWSRIEQQADD